MSNDVAGVVRLQSSEAAKAGRLGFVAGLIPQEKLNGFERLLFRATRGNMFLRQTPVGSVKDPATGEQQEKHVFVVFYAGERARTKVLKVTSRSCSAAGIHWMDANSLDSLLMVHFGLRLLLL